MQKYLFYSTNIIDIAYKLKIVFNTEPQREYENLIPNAKGKKKKNIIIQ